MDETTQKIAEIEKKLVEHGTKLNKFEDLDYRMNTHRHTGSDLTNKLDSGSSNVVSYNGHMSHLGVFQLPTGWTGLINAVGNTTITHNLGIADYNVSLTPFFTGNYAYQLYIIDTTHFGFYSYTHNAGVFTQSNTGFTFILTPYSA